MKNKLKTGTVFSLFVALLVGSAPSSFAVEPVLHSVCNALLTPSLPQFSEHSDAAIPQTFVAKSKTLAAKYGVPNFDGKNYVDLVDQVYRGLRVETTYEALASADKMAKFGMELDELLVGVPKSVRQTTWFNVGFAVNDLEGFKESELIASTLNPVIDTKPGLVRLNQYPDYTRGFVDGTPPYTDHVGWGTGSVLQIGEYRDVVSHNLWPMWLKPHDMHHVHFAYGHPKAVGLYFKSTRSKNPKRFVMMAGMYEGVDTVQYAHETSLAKYFSNSMKMGLEDSMLWIGKASDQELNRIISAAQIDITRFTQPLEGWVPKVKIGFEGSTEKELDQEIFDFVQNSEAALKDPTKAKYTNYHRASPDTQGSTWDKDFAHFGGMQNMPAPNLARPVLPADHAFDLDFVTPYVTPVYVTPVVPPVVTPVTPVAPVNPAVNTTQATTQTTTEATTATPVENPGIINRIRNLFTH